MAEERQEIKMEEKKMENKAEEAKKDIEKETARAKEEKAEAKNEKKDKAEKKIEIKKKDKAIVNGKDLHISKKHSMAICDLIRGKKIESMILELELISRLKKPLKMKGEIPHRKGNIMSGRYPIKASEEFIRLLKSLKANAMVNELELEKYKIFCKANIAPRPYKRFGRGRFKRSHVTLKLIQINKNKKNKEKK